MSEPEQETVPTEAEPDEAEPDEAEPDEDADDDEPDEPDEDEQAPAQQESGARVEAIGKKLDLLRKHVAKRMGEILEEDAPLYRECMCSEVFGTPGYLPPIDPTEDARAFMLHWMGQHAPSDYKPDRLSRGCDKCNGLGQVETGSHVLGQEYLPCYDCDARGWVPVGPERDPRIAAPRTGGTAANGTQTPEPPPPPPPPPPDTPEVEALKRAGYVVIPPPVLAT